MSSILIVEDDILTAKLFCYIAESQGHEAVHAMDGFLALEAIEKSQFDLIFMDIHMPGMNGFDVLKKLKEKNATSDVPVIAVTASTIENSDRELYLMSGFSEYIFKPVFVDKLKEIMGRYLGSSDI